MLAFLKKNHRLLFYGSWIILGILQAYFTELQDDEAYYWVYSLFPAAGYFDHPPMIALLIKAGTFFQTTALFVRIFPFALNVLSIYITEKLTVKKNPFLFYAICYSIAVLHLAGFFAVPDIPLVFFSALLFLLYKRYLLNNSWTNAVLIGIVSALLLYSKYHGLLVLFFIVLSNIKILSDKKIITAGFIALLLFLPHLLWQFDHDWVTFRYHLAERNSDAYDYLYTTDYLLGQLLLLGPLAGFIVWPVSFIYKPSNKFDKALKWTAIGFFLFFLASTIKGRVEANWTAPAIIPIMVLSHQYLLDHYKWRKWFLRLLPLSVILIFFGRIITVVNVIPADAIIERYFAWRKWPKELSDKTKGFPVVFNSNYQRASKFWFYSGNTSYSLNSFSERQNNYNLWPIEDSLLGKPAFVMDIYRTDTFANRIKTPLWTIGYSKENQFYSFVKMRFTPEKKMYNIHYTDSLDLNFNWSVPRYYLNFLDKYPETDIPFKIALLDREFPIKEVYTGFCLQDLIHKNIHHVRIAPRLMKGKYILLFVLGSSDGTYTRNSDKVELYVN